MLAKAISITSQAFENKLDKGGNPYILHCLRVWQAVRNEDEDVQCAAVLHDLIEDTDWEFPQLYEAGFSAKTVHIVALLTHQSHNTYDDYIKAISLDKDATKIKLADLRDNSDITRLKGLTKKDFDRVEKYHRHFTYLSKI